MPCRSNSSSTIELQASPEQQLAPVGLDRQGQALGRLGQGLARQILSALGREARRRGLERAFLQVEAANTGARALYRRAGFQSAWDYAYWTRPGLP